VTYDRGEIGKSARSETVKTVGHQDWRRTWAVFDLGAENEIMSTRPAGTETHDHLGTLNEGESRSIGDAEAVSGRCSIPTGSLRSLRSRRRVGNSRGDFKFFNSSIFALETDALTVSWGGGNDGGAETTTATREARREERDRNKSSEDD